ncbi:MAG: response regulator [Rhodoferax sp.]|uniref:response regulator n=1 Tax=Rhodoferax sp. TaxID=50421 RepID=UPI001B410BE1|nr:response regulator [Rhodoferax sp.]MBP9905787.1 response regulator [Rhodoferax sp.]
MANILVVDDELGIRDLLSEILNDEGHSVEVAENAAQARASRQRERPDLVLLDIWMPDTDGVTLLKEWSATGALTMPVIMMSGHATIDTAVEATRIGALAFLEKPITLQKLLKAVEQGLSKGSMRRLTVPPAALPARGVDGVPYALESVSSVAELVPEAGPQVTQTFMLDKPLREGRDEYEKAYFEFHLAKENGSMTRVAEKTGLERTHLYRKLKQLGVDLSRGKRA